MTETQTTQRTATTRNAPASLITEITTMQRISSTDIRFFLRINGITIRAIAAHMGITLKRVRFVRNNGITGIGCTDWMQAIGELA